MGVGVVIPQEEFFELFGRALKQNLEMDNAKMILRDGLKTNKIEKQQGQTAAHSAQDDSALGEWINDYGKILDCILAIPKTQKRKAHEGGPKGGRDVRHATSRRSGSESQLD